MTANGSNRMRLLPVARPLAEEVRPLVEAAEVTPNVAVAPAKFGSVESGWRSSQ